MQISSASALPSALSLLSSSWVICLDSVTSDDNDDDEGGGDDNADGDEVEDDVNDGYDDDDDYGDDNDNDDDDDDNDDEDLSPPYLSPLFKAWLLLRTPATTVCMHQLLHLKDWRSE